MLAAHAAGAIDYSNFSSDRRSYVREHLVLHAFEMNRVKEVWDKRLTWRTLPDEQKTQEGLNALNASLDCSLHWLRDGSASDSADSGNTISDDLLLEWYRVFAPHMLSAALDEIEAKYDKEA